MYRRSPALLKQRLGAEQFAQFMTRYMVDAITTTTVLLEFVATIGGAESATWFRAALAAID
jgi:hypothetical protein